MAIRSTRRVVVLASLIIASGLVVPVAVATGPGVPVVNAPLRTVLVAFPAAWAEPVRFRWPLDGQPKVVRHFDPPPKPWLAGHRGVDLAAEPGAVVRSPAAGVVSFSGWIAGRGVISVQHEGGVRTTYEPVEPDVHVGTRVAAGTPLGVLAPGHPGCPLAACLHWGLRRGEEYLDPLSLLGLGRVRLLPTGRRAPGARRRPARLQFRRRRVIAPPGGGNSRQTSDPSRDRDGSGTGVRLTVGGS